MHVCNSRRCARRRGQPATSRQLLSCSVPRRHAWKSRLCLSAPKFQTESSCQFFRESSSCARVSAARCASGSLHLYSWTRHSVVPLASREIELHSTTSFRRVRFLVHAATRTSDANRTSLTRWDFMAPNIANGASAEQQEHVVKCVGPGSYTESAEQVEAAEKQAGDRPKHERIDVKPVAKWADIVERGENERADYRRGHAGEQRTQAQQFRCAPREQTDEDDAEQTEHEQARPPGAGEPDEHGLENDVGAVADGRAARCGWRERRKNLIDDQEGQGEQQAVTGRSAGLPIGANHAESYPSPGSVQRPT